MGLSGRRRGPRPPSACGQLLDRRVRGLERRVHSVRGVHRIRYRGRVVRVVVRLRRATPRRLPADAGNCAGALVAQGRGRGLPTNGFGVYNTTGNVFEWTPDWFHPSFRERDSSIDPPQAGREVRARFRRVGPISVTTRTAAGTGSPRVTPARLILDGQATPKNLRASFCSLAGRRTSTRSRPRS